MVDVDQERPLLTTQQAAKLLGISRRTLARYVVNGDVVPTVTLPSGHHRWDIVELRRQLRGGPRDDD